MKICVNCGKENENWLCDNCKEKVNIIELCNNINAYDYNEKSNPIFNTIC